MSEDTLLRVVQRRLQVQPHTVLWPINIGNTHWVLIILEPLVPRILYYDSLWNFPFPLLVYIQDLLNKIPSGQIQSTSILMHPIYEPRQTDGHSCGPCVTLIAQRRGQEIMVTQEELQTYRRQVLTCILRDDTTVQDLELEQCDPFPLPSGRGDLRPLPAEIPLLIPQWPGRHVIVAPSSIPGAGLGLFTTRPITFGPSRRDNIICRYDGDRIPHERAHSASYLSDYIWENTAGTLVIDAASPLSCFGRYVNDHFEEDQCNCEIREIDGSAYVLALTDIPRGELFLSYGRSYWEEKVINIPPGPFREACCRRYNLVAPTPPPRVEEPRPAESTGGPGLMPPPMGVARWRHQQGTQPRGDIREYKS